MYYPEQHREHQHHHYLTIEDMRRYMRDRSAEDNELWQGILNDDDEIQFAMDSCAREYNSLPPMGIDDGKHGKCLDTHTNMFYDGTAYFLCLAAMTNLMNNDAAYVADNVTASMTKDRINHLQNVLCPMYKERFEVAAKARKQQLNVRAGFGIIW